MWIFDKGRMIARLKEEGREDMIDDGILAIMDNLDGCEAKEYCWERYVNDEPVYWVVGKDGTGQYVNENDCIPA